MDFIQKVKNLKQGKDELILGSWINTASPIVSEIMSASGFDFLCLDAEHSALDYNNSLQILQAIKAGNPNCFPLVRMQGNSYADTKRYLDAGTLGVIAPLINSKAEAERLVESVYYPPKGNRGVGYGRCNAYGFDFENYMDFANENLFVAIQVEHIEAVKNFEEIAKVEGIDAVFVGPYDLTASMGITAQFDNKDYLEILTYINKKCKEYGLISGIHVVQPSVDEVFSKYNLGYRMIAYSLDITIIGTYCRNAVSQIREKI
jgi:2-dehydro-3-deoxyglucarate aldolase